MKKSDLTNFIILLLLVVVIVGCGVGYIVAKNGMKTPAGPGAVIGSENNQPVQPTPPPEPTPPSQPSGPDGQYGGQSGPDGQYGGQYGPGYGPGGQSGPGYGPGGQSGPGYNAPEREQFTVRGLDFEAIRALHEPDEIVGSVAGRDVTWEEYFYWLHDIGSQAEEYARQLAMYGQRLDWTDKLSAASDATLAEYVIELTQDYSGQLNLIEAVAEESGATLTEENEEEIAERLQETITSLCGADGTEDDFNELLEGEMVSRAMYDRLERANYLYQNAFTAIYGEKGEKVSDEDAMSYLEDNGYLCASHILLASRDFRNATQLTDEEVAQKLEQAEAISEELRAIEDDEERVKRFAELKAEYCEDTGKEDYPDGYLFTPGTMVSEFEDAVKSLADYEVSEPIRSGYGYHVIIRLPLDADMTMRYSEAGTALSARAVYANEQYNTMMSARMDENVFTLRDGFEIDLTQYLK